MSSSYKNRIPKRKYRERAQPTGRHKFGLLQKKQDYKQRAKNYHEKQQLMNKYKLKAGLKNDDEFYFQMIRNKRGEDGKHIQVDEDESDLDAKELRTALKTENYNLVKLQRAALQQKISKAKAHLHLLHQMPQKQHIVYVQTQQQLHNFNTAQYFKTQPEFINHNLLDVNAQQLQQQIALQETTNPQLKQKYTRLAEYIEKQQKLTKLLMKIGYEKNLLGSERKIIKKGKAGKFHKFYMQRKK